MRQHVGKYVRPVVVAIVIALACTSASLAGSLLTLGVDQPALSRAVAA